MCLWYLPSVLCIRVIVFCFSYPMYISVVDMRLSFVRIKPVEKVYCRLLLQQLLSVCQKDEGCYNRVWSHQQRDKEDSPES